MKFRKVSKIDERPKFQGWAAKDYFNAHIPSIEPMVCKEFDEKYIKKFAGLWLASCKYDGHRAVCIVTPEGDRFFSRRVSKKTGWFAENTDNLPHLRDMKGLPVGTILDGELIHHSGFSAVQSVTGSLTEKAIEFQKQNGWLEYHVFDLLQHGNDNYMNMDYVFRASMLQKINIFKDVPIYVTDEVVKEGLETMRGLKTVLVDSFDKLRDQLWAEGKEGIILKHGSSKYSPGKRSTEWLKVKNCKTADVIITGFQEPTREYDGKTLGDKGYWDYWEDSRGVKVVKRMSINEAKNLEPVTKPYALEWIGAIEFGLERGGKAVKIGEAKGISDADQEYIKEHRSELIGTVIEVKYQEIIDKKTLSLRHPRFNRWREDKGAESCTWMGFGT